MKTIIYIIIFFIFVATLVHVTYDYIALKVENDEQDKERVF